MSSPVVPSAYFRKLAHSAGASDAHFRKPSYNPLPTHPHPPTHLITEPHMLNAKTQRTLIASLMRMRMPRQLPSYRGRPRLANSRGRRRSYALWLSSQGDRALRKAAPLPPPHGSGGPFYRYELPRDVLIRVLSDSIGSPKDYAHVSRACLQFNDAAVGKGVLAAVVSVAPYERGGVATTMARQAQDQAVAAGKTGKTKRRESSSNTVRHYSGIGAGVVLVVRRTCGR